MEIGVSDNAPDLKQIIINKMDFRPQFCYEKLYTGPLLIFDKFDVNIVHSNKNSKILEIKNINIICYLT